MTGTAVPAGAALPADEGWAILALPAGKRDLALEEYWEASFERSLRRRCAKRRLRVVRSGASRMSLALAAVALAAPAASALGADSAAAATTTGAPSLALGRGSTGAAVRALQQKLGIPADGIFGPQTERAVRAFQRAHGIPATGFVGPLTTAALGLTAEVGSSRATSSTGGTPAPTVAQTTTPAAAPGVQTAVAAAMSKIGAPYRYGATGPSSFDCSGLVQWAMRQGGISVPRTSYAQYGIGTRIATSQIQAGDLVFFDTAGPGASDVGLATGPATAVSATTHGVMAHSTLTGYWGAHFVGARRIA
jgi:cell wall-associated NlpC family hydrolase